MIFVPPALPRIRSSRQRPQASSLSSRSPRVSPPTTSCVCTPPRSNERRSRLIGPNCPGILSPGKANVDIIPAAFFRESIVGLVSRSGTLTYQIGNVLAQWPSQLGRRHPSACAGPRTGCGCCDVLSASRALLRSWRSAARSLLNRRADLPPSGSWSRPSRGAAVRSYAR